MTCQTPDGLGEIPKNPLLDAADESGVVTNLAYALHFPVLGVGAYQCEPSRAALERVGYLARLLLDHTLSVDKLLDRALRVNKTLHPIPGGAAE